jgi:hypothetical protein
MERNAGAPLLPGVGRFESLLKPFNLKPKITDEVRRELNDILAVRNLLVHRAGKIDRRFIELCPWLNRELGETIEVSRDDLTRDISSTSEYVTGKINAATSHPFF